MNSALKITVIVPVYKLEHYLEQCVRSIIGRRCWLCANVVVTRGCAIADRLLVSANSVVARSLCDEGALYAGSQACLIKRYN